MTGLLASQGIRASQARVGKALKDTHPQYHNKRVTSSAKLLNPLSYTADYFGHKLHIDAPVKKLNFMLNFMLYVTCWIGIGNVRYQEISLPMIISNFLTVSTWILRTG